MKHISIIPCLAALFVFAGCEWCSCVTKKEPAKSVEKTHIETNTKDDQTEKQHLMQKKETEQEAKTQESTKKPEQKPLKQPFPTEQKNQIIPEPLESIDMPKAPTVPPVPTLPQEPLAPKSPSVPAPAQAPVAAPKVASVPKTQPTLNQEQNPNNDHVENFLKSLK